MRDIKSARRAVNPVIAEYPAPQSTSANLSPRLTAWMKTCRAGAPGTAQTLAADAANALADLHCKRTGFGRYGIIATP